jgi:hypothetical protein
VLSTSTSATSRSGVASSAAQSAITSTIKVAVETAVHVGLTAAGQSSAVKQMSRNAFGTVSKDETLTKIRLVSAALSTGHGAALEALYTTLAAKALKQTPTAQEFAVGAAAGLISSGILGASAYLLYRNDPSFREGVDGLIQPLRTAIPNFLNRSGTNTANPLDLENNARSTEATQMPPAEPAA